MADKQHYLNRLFQDRLFWLALGIAPVIVGLMVFILPPGELHLDWPLKQPLQFFSLIVLFPWAEEIVFRGMLQPLLSRLLPEKTVIGFGWANLVTSVLFGTAHGLMRSASVALAVFVPSMIFGFFRDRYRSIVPGIALHGFYNFCYFMVYNPL